MHKPAMYGMILGLVLTASALLLIPNRVTPALRPNPFVYEQKPLPPGQTSSLIRIETQDGRFFCSGVVVSKTRVLTAAHCIVLQDPTGKVRLRRDVMLIKSEYAPQVVTQGMAYTANGMADYGIIVGDFSKFNIAKITTSTTLMFSLSQNLAACGYPWGSDSSVCYPLMPRSGDSLSKGFHFGFKGFLYPGMSGGPVIDRESGLVFAINSAVDLGKDELVIAPLIGLNELIKNANKKHGN